MIFSKVSNFTASANKKTKATSFLAFSPFDNESNKTLTPLQCLALASDSIASLQYNGRECVAVVVTSKTLEGLAGEFDKLTQGLGISANNYVRGLKQLHDWEREKFLITPPHKGVFLGGYNSGQAFSFAERSGQTVASNTAPSFSAQSTIGNIKNRANAFKQAFAAPQPKNITGLKGVYAKALGVANAETHAAKIKSDEGLPVSGYVYTAALVFIAPTSDIAPIKQAFGL